MNNTEVIEEHIEYELIDIEFNVNYDSLVDVPMFACEESNDDISNSSNLQYDADGIPMGHSKEDVDVRRKIIFDYIQNWRAIHAEPYIFNEDLKDFVKVNQIFMIESVEHASKGYLSTKAVLMMEEIIQKAKKIGTVNTKEGNSNQKPFKSMIILLFKTSELGNVKMTVGIRKRTEEKVQYSITVPKPGKAFIEDSLAKKNAGKRKKRSR